MSGEKVEKKKISPSLIVAVIVIIVLLAALVYYTTLPPKVEVVPTTIVQTALKTETLPGTTIVRTEVKTTVQTIPVTPPPTTKPKIKLLTAMVFKDTYPKLISEFEKKTGIEVEVVYQKWSKRFELATTQGTTGVYIFDVIDMDCIWTGPFADAGWVVNLDDRIKKEPGVIADIPEALLASFRYKGSQYGIPYWADTKLLVYNEKMLKDVGATKAPESLEELLEIAQKVTKPGVYGLVMPWTQDETLLCDYVTFLYGFGGKFFDEKFKPLFNDTAGVEALQFMVDLIHKYKVVDPTSLTIYEDEAAKILGAGKAAMMLNWLCYVEPPNTTLATPEVKGNIRVALWPGSAKKGIKSSSCTGPSSYAIMSTSPHKDEAWELIKFLTSPEVTKTVFIETKVPGGHSSVFEDPEVKPLIPFYKTFLEQLKYAGSRPSIPAYSKIAEKIILYLHKALTLEMTPKEALDKAAEEVIKILAGS
jgi:multiple sugar transport system substrate-binding protein